MTNNQKTQQSSILVVDDELSVRDSLSKWFKEDGYRVGAAENANRALSLMNEGPWDVILLDIKMPGMDGLELQKRLKEIDKEAAIIMVTAFAAVDSAVQALKEGAFDYITKPVDPEHLSHLVQNALRTKKLTDENWRLRQQMSELSGVEEIVGESPQMKKVIDLAKTVAQTDTTAMIRGESGTGKELIARMIHANSARKYFPIIVVNCGAVPETLLESELFGHEKGAFTGAQFRRKGKFEMADGGTVFLDEIGTISQKMQVQLLRVLESKQFTRVGGNEIISSDFRVICATNRDLEAAIADKSFREDLYYRLNVFTIFIPPLRERRVDIPPLVNHFIKEYATSMNKPMLDIDPEAMDLLIRNRWPGNIRELENVIERAMVLAKPPAIRREDLPFQLSQTQEENGAQDDSLAGAEKVHIARVLDKMGWNITRAAEVLSIDRVTLYSKISKYGIKKP
ncbi:MAG: sigma-54 dependent transcriptional regulator [Bacteroidetes bacterium]|nr:sigma-54 dependent transcriptional regulator [Bacteroidota bacterium]MCL5737194.1 sigma-54 dependent transcriptional regulator [Bacteroidota bacterium]